MFILSFSSLTLRDVEFYLIWAAFACNIILNHILVYLLSTTGKLIFLYSWRLNFKHGLFIFLRQWLESPPWNNVWEGYEIFERRGFTSVYLCTAFDEGRKAIFSSILYAEIFVISDTGYLTWEIIYPLSLVKNQGMLHKFVKYNNIQHIL